MDAVDEEMLSFAVGVRGSAQGELRQFVNQFWGPQMKANLRMFFLRHAAFQMSINSDHHHHGQSYNAYTYWREDNYFLEGCQVIALETIPLNRMLLWIERASLIHYRIRCI